MNKEKTMKYEISLSLTAVLLLLSACNKQQQIPPTDIIVEENYQHKYGVAVTPEDWLERGGDGQVVTKLANGVVVTKNYEGGVIIGEATYTFPHSKIIAKSETYHKGILIKEVEHYSTGIPKQERRYISSWQMNLTLWDEKGVPQSVETYRKGLLTKGEYFNQTHQLESQVENGEGVKTVRDAYGQLICREVISAGEKTLSTTYYPNGSPNEVIPYANNLIEGEKKSYLPSGEPHTIEQWAAGKQHGTTIIFKNGSKSIEESYYHGIKNGAEIHYGDDGLTVAQELTWKNGVAAR
jgi:antitoxin component YwqK of YwqJK toxin-antitoxin module